MLKACHTKEDLLMKIGIIGAGHMGATLARLLVKVGYAVALSNSRDPSSLKELTLEIGPKCVAKSSAEAAKWADMVVLMMPWTALRDLQIDVGGKIVIDSLNPFNLQGNLIDLEGRASSEIVQQIFPQSRIVKAFNTIWDKNLAQNSRRNAPLEERDVLFMASDDPEAVKIVAQLIEDIGFAPLLIGSLRESRLLQEPNMKFYDVPMNLQTAVAMQKG